MQKKRKSAEDSALFDNVASEKLKFPLYIFSDTMEKVNMLYETDNCRSKTEFMEKAIRFYCGYLLNKESTATYFIAPQVAVITEGIVKDSEQKLSRALFKLAVEVGALTHMLAAINEIDDETLKKLRIMCVDEVKRINGIINFEKAVRYQRMKCSPFVRQYGIIEIYQLKSLTKGGIFMPKGQPNKRYTPEFKIKVVETMHREKLSYRETARQFDIPNSRVTAWERIYLEEGAEGLYVERRGRKSTGRSPKIKKEVEEDLIAEVQRLRAENAYLKKLNALVAERVRQEKKHK